MRLLLLILSLISLSSQAGISVHLLLMARLELPELPLSPLLSGAFYPDSFYNCLGLSSMGEYNHWSPFVYELVKFYTELPEEDLEFKAFIYGVLSHQIADITWHSLRLHQGLLKYLNNVEFKNDKDFTRSHSFLDSGGDFVVLERLLKNTSAEKRQEILRYFKTPWKFPTRHLVSVYHRLGHNEINESNLRYCMFRGYAALQAEISSMLAAPTNLYAEQSPIFMDVLDTYYLGGIYEITHTINSCLPNLEYWFHHIDEVRDPTTICDTFKGSTYLLSKSAQMQGNATLITPYAAGSNFGSSIAVGKFLGDGTDCVAVGAPFEDSVGSVYVLPLDLYGISSTPTIKHTYDSRQTMQYPPRFGSKLIAFHSEFLCVASPGSSSLKFFYAERELLELVYSGNNIMGGIGLKQLGTLLELDAHVNIVIGSKYADYDSRLEQKGIIFVLDGDAILMQLLQSLLGKAQSLRMERFVKRRLELPLYLHQVSNYENFGSQYAAVGRYTAISVENLGVVVIYLDDEPWKVITCDLRVLNYDDDELIGVTKRSSSESAQFGASFLKTTTIDNKHYLLVSSKAASASNCVQCGSVLLFQLSDEIKLIAQISLSDAQNFVQFGDNAVQARCGQFYISSMNYDDRGSIWGLDIAKIIKSYDGSESVEYQLTEDQLVQLGPRESGYTGFGSSLGYTRDRLIVGMPYYGYNEVYDSSSGLIGKVGFYQV